VPPAENHLQVIETFLSLQGESSWAGMPCFFIRLAGCPLRCRWCDTTYAYSGGAPATIESLGNLALESGVRLVEVTGGEPLAQQYCPDLCAWLLDHGLTVLVETSGSLPIWQLPEGVIRIMDLKCPDSGESERNLWENLNHLTARDEVKFVIASGRDYEWAQGVVTRYSLPQKVSSVLFSPVTGLIEPVTLAEWILADRLPVRFQLQLHKILWSPDQRGV